MLINERETARLKQFDSFKGFIKYLNDMNDIFKNIEMQETRNAKYWEVLISDMVSNKKFNSVLTELFIRERKLNICLVFIK